MGTPARMGVDLGGLSAFQGGGLDLGSGPIAPAAVIQDGAGHTPPISWTDHYEEVGAGADFYDVDTATTHIHGSVSYAIETQPTRGGSVASKAFPVTDGETFYCSIWVHVNTAVTGGFQMR